MVPFQAYLYSSPNALQMFSIEGVCMAKRKMFPCRPIAIPRAAVPIFNVPVSHPGLQQVAASHVLCIKKGCILSKVHYRSTLVYGVRVARRFAITVATVLRVFRPW